jgi:L-alanine-DL-glutamate epimerase-like enolase superfamily enzyme
MKITNVEVIKVYNTFKNVGSSWSPVVVKINTDEGISGFGEVGLAYGRGATAGFGMVKDLSPLLIGENPMNIEHIWDKLMKKTFWGQGGGTVISSAMSGIDGALWDIKGKALGVPVYKLLGGKTNKKLRSYASQLQFGWGRAEDKSTNTSPEEYVEAAQIAISEGFDAIKIDPLGYDLDANWNKWKLTGSLRQEQIKIGYNRLKAVRDAIGDDVDIIVELHAFTDVATSIQFAHAIKDLKIFFYEEPTMPLNSKLMKIVRDSIDIPVAAGERIYTRWGYAPFFEDRSLDVIQPDFANCGGITEGKKVCDMAHAYDITVQGHVCGGPISTAMALHIETSIPNFIIHEHHRYAQLKANTDTCVYDYQPINGCYQVPEIPGIGQELKPEIIEKSEVVIVK